MAKKILRSGLSDEYDFKLIGIVCQHKEYRLCHFLNQRLLIRLHRDADYEIMKPQNKQTLSFPLYKYEPEDQARYYLFANKAGGGILIPDHKNMDFFLMIKEYHNRVNEDKLLNDIKSIPLVLGAYPVQAERLRAKENLLF